MLGAPAKSLLLGDRGRLGMPLAIFRVSVPLAGENAIAALGRRGGAELEITATIEVDPDHRIGAAVGAGHVSGSIEGVGLRRAGNGNSRQSGGQSHVIELHLISPRDGLTNPSNIVSRSWIFAMQHCRTESRPIGLFHWRLTKT